VKSRRTPPEGFAAVLITGNQRCRSWREKLALVQELLGEGSAPLAREQLVDIAIYLRFLGTGEIRCSEDGRHFRPGHHANISLRIQERLATLDTPENTFLLRKIQPWLPSAAAEYRRAEPLTRIRDIAHRNDIPQALKREIKDTLQNKLHRCAGPEDLATADALLERVTAPGAGYAADFVAQFRIFHAELQEFFNARSLEKRLEALQPRLGEDDRLLAARLLGLKNGTGASNQLATLQVLTDLRQGLAAALRPPVAPENRDWLLTDIGLEDFAFVLLSEVINGCEELKGRAALAPLLEALELALRNLALSAQSPAEAAALAAETGAWRERLNLAQREQLLRLKATADRARRLAGDCGDRILALYQPRAERLGRGLGVAEPAIRVFCEAEIRSHVIFQLAKVASALLRRLRAALALPPWDVLVPGQVEGRLRLADTLADFGGEFSGTEPTIVLLKRAAGDEELGPDLVAIVLAHELPHLSHLAVRARQAGVVLVSGDHAAKLQELRSAQGQTIALEATAEGVTWKPRATEVEPVATVAAQETAVEPPAVSPRATVRLAGSDVRTPAPCLPLEDITADTGGAKAASVRRLAELSRDSASRFSVPPGVVVPFGVMEQVLEALPELKAEYDRLLGAVELASAKGFPAVVDQLRGLLGELPVPEALLAKIAAAFGGEDRLMVRSSANCEDLAAMAGAGLYDSVANVRPDDIAGGVRTAWASLWNLRAALSRRQAGIPHAQARMAVLIQQMVTPDLSFVLHTVNPVNHNPREVYMELAVGMGEAVVSGAVPGQPYRLVFGKDGGAARVLAFASFSHALRPGPEAGLVRETIDYSRVPFSADLRTRRELAARLAALAVRVEQALGGPQDIEGVVAGDEIYLVQARPQQGIPAQ
jgi:phosphoglucan,water dikinase